MKKNKLIFALLSALMGLFALQSCTKDNTTYKVYNSFTTPTATAPLESAHVSITGTTVDLKWVSSDKDGDAVKCDVYFGTTDKPGLYKTGLTTLSLTVPVVEGGAYYWYVVMTDANNIKTTSPLWDFTVAVNYTITNFVGLYDCNEPGYKHYDVHFTKVDNNTVSNDNFWDSGWAVNYVFDSYGKVTLTPVSYVGGTVTYDITGDGTFNPATNGVIVHYVVKNHATGAVADDNTHTFVKK
jgi:hypothetical protein